MMANSVCHSCLRTLIRQPRPQHLRSTIHASANVLTRRTFATTQATAQAAKPTPQSPTPPSISGSPPQVPSAKPLSFANLAAKLRDIDSIRSTTEPYIAYGGTEDLFLECSRQCNYTIPAILQKPPTEPPLTKDGEEIGVGSGWWLEPKSKGGLGLPVTFNTWAQVMFLHMWILTVRFRCFPKEYVKNWDQHLLDHFFFAAEDRMVMWHRMSSRSVRNKYLKDLWTQWRGVLVSYDEGLVKGDAVMATAVWRNIFRADEGVDVQDLAKVTEYVMKELKRVGEAQDAVITEGRIRFSGAARAPAAAAQGPKPIVGEVNPPAGTTSPQDPNAA